MGERRGVFKTGCLGCLGLLVLLAVFVGINAVLVLNRAGDERIENRQLDSQTSGETAPLEKSVRTEAGEDKPAAGRGWLILDLGQGDFEIHPGEPGDGVVIKANYDAAIYELQQYSHTWPDSAWVYHVRGRRTISGVQAILREVMGGNHPTRVHIYIPPDLPIELNLLVKEGGLEAELGGLWLTDMDLRYDKGGISLGIERPLREPVGSLVIHGRMGGAEIAGLGNASPAILDVSCAMGGMSLGLTGDWVRDCDTRLSLSMGGMQVDVPDNLVIDSGVGSGDGLNRTDVEIVRPVMRIRQESKMGEIEFR